MKISPDITATILFHDEGALALPALASMRDMVEASRDAGLTVEARALLDSPDDVTRDLVRARGDWLSHIDEVSVKDPGLARNAGAAMASGEYLAFLDGDDLWGKEWLTRAHHAAAARASTSNAIWHPECLYYFYESDFDRRSADHVPHKLTRSFYMIHGGVEDPGFDRNTLLLNNLWTANVFGSRAIYLRHPYIATAADRGFGVEDWTWNIETIWADIPHLVVPDTVHLIRVKESGSFGQGNAVKGLLPRLPSRALPRFGPSGGPAPE